MNNQVTIHKDTLLKVYNECSSKQKVLLVNLFGKDIFNTKNIRERVKNFEDAVRELAEYCGEQFIDIWADFLLV